VSIDVWGPIPVSGSPPLWVPPPPSPSVISMTDQRSWLQLCMYVSRVCRVWLGNSCEDVGLVSIDVWGPIPVSGSPPLWVPHAANRAMLFVRLIILMTP